MQHLVTSYGLNQTQLDAIATLAMQCNKLEKLDMKLNWERLKSRPADEVNDFLCYEDDMLVGYLALYAFNRHEVEISAMTAPGYRRQGIFKQLVASAKTEVAHRGIPDMLFICERISAAVKPCMAALGAQYEFSEYKMVLGQPTAPVTLPEQILLRPASTADLEIMTMMDHLCFDVPLEPQKAQTNDQPPQPRPGTQLITRNGQPIGKIHTTQSDDESYIAGFCMLPEYRGQGIGRAVLSQVVAQLVAEQRPNIVLEVATSNESALSLYKRQGFETSTAFDYYRLPILKDKKP